MVVGKSEMQMLKRRGARKNPCETLFLRYTAKKQSNVCMFSC